MVNLKFVSLETAREFSGHRSNAGLTKWLQRFNRKHPDALVLKRSAHIELNSLLRGLMLDAAEKTPGYGVSITLAELSRGGRA